MAATTTLRTRIRFRPPKIRLHCRLILKVCYAGRLATTFFSATQRCNAGATLGDSRSQSRPHYIVAVEPQPQLAACILFYIPLLLDQYGILAYANYYNLSAQIQAPDNISENLNFQNFSGRACPRTTLACRALSSPKRPYCISPQYALPRLTNKKCLGMLLATIRNNVATMLQRCVALKIVVANRLLQHHLN